MQQNNEMHEFRSEGMTCQGCVRAVTRAVKALDPEAEVFVDLDQQGIRVRSDEGRAALKSAIEESGYPVLESAKVG